METPRSISAWERSGVLLRGSTGKRAREKILPFSVHAEQSLNEYCPQNTPNDAETILGTGTCFAFYVSAS